MIILPDNLDRYGIDWRGYPISKVVKMSSMIPYLFQPVIIQKNQHKTYILDGGILSNYPIWLFDSKDIPRWPTFGYRLRESDYTPPAKITGTISMSMAILSTMLEANDRRYINRHNAARTIFIPVQNIRAIDFAITEEQKRELIQLGRNKAKKFFDNWNFPSYINQYRRLSPSIKISNN